MAKTESAETVSERDTLLEVAFGSDSELPKVERAVAASDFDSPEDLVREATLKLAAEVLDERLECPRDGCEETFKTERERRGHLGSSEHALDVPEGDFWCGYCGYGPTTWRGLNAHHGSSDHNGDPVRLEEEPDQDDLLAPDDVPDHKNPELLKRLYHEHDGNCTEMCRQHDFEVTASRVRHYLIEFEIHEVTPNGPIEDGDGPLYRDREWLQKRYDEANGNISEMHRQIENEDEVDVPYRTLVKNLKNLDIHDPEESPGRSQAWEQRDDEQTEKTGDDDETDDVAESDSSPTEQSVPAPGERAFVLEWGRWGPPQSGKYHLDDDCWVLNRKDSDRDVVPLPRPLDEIEADDDWSVCGHCANSTEADGATDETPDEDDEPAGRDEDLFAVIETDDPDDVESFGDLATPDWLAEGSFYVALDMSDTAEEFAENLGWGDPEDLQQMVSLLGREDEFVGGDGD